jgi:hypothetical protein
MLIHIKRTLLGESLIQVTFDVGVISMAEYLIGTSLNDLEVNENRIIILRMGPTGSKESQINLFHQ